MNTMQNLETEEQPMKSQKVSHYKCEDVDIDIVWENLLCDSYLVLRYQGKTVQLPLLAFWGENVK